VDPRVERIEELLDKVEGVPEATELVQALLELYGEGLRRIVPRLDGALDDLAHDELVAHLLLLHGLHPVPLATRVEGALEEMRPYLDTHGGDVRLLGVDEGVVRLQLQGSCSGCPSSALTLRHGIEEAIYKAAPDVDRIEAEDAPEPNGGLLQIEDLTCPLPGVDH
jgi:Fe-S cluster biogenesis protein NfuA